jgi:hypothetical protein
MSMHATRSTPLVLLLLVALALLVSGCGSVDITRARLEREIAPTFTNYANHAREVAGKDGPGATHAKASCEKGGPEVADQGSGKDWVCAVTYRDASGAERESRYEVNVHTEACYTATDPKLTAGHQSMTDAHGDLVDNPLYQFDGCFDPTG